MSRPTTYRELTTAELDVPECANLSADAEDDDLTADAEDDDDGFNGFDLPGFPLLDHMTPPPRNQPSRLASFTPADKSKFISLVNLSMPSALLAAKGPDETWRRSFVRQFVAASKLFEKTDTVSTGINFMSLSTP